jgi:multicomponent Na+:H+ antiporter subunit E
MMKKAFLFMLWYLVWCLLAWPPSMQHMIIGIFVASFVSLMTNDMFSGKPLDTRLNPARYMWFLYYVAVFAWECFKANIDVAYRVLHPDLPIKPGTIRVKTSLKSDAGLTFLANSVTLTPGTTSVDIDRDKGLIYIHMLYISDSYDKDSMKLKVVDKFEKILRRIFE